MHCGNHAESEGTAIVKEWAKQQEIAAAMARVTAVIETAEAVAMNLGVTKGKPATKGKKKSARVLEDA